MGEFRWYLTGRFPVIAVPELARRALGDGPRYRAFLTAEAIDETILHPGEYASTGGGADPVPTALGGIDDGTGSNNWVIGPSRSASGAAMVASDPHIAFGAPNCWYQAHLVGLNLTDETVAAAADNLYRELWEQGIETLYDDRPDQAAGVKLNDADLMGLPLRLVVSPRNLRNNAVELKGRAETEAAMVALDQAPEAVRQALALQSE